MNTKNTVVAGVGVAAKPAIEPTPYKPQNFGQLEPIEAEPRARPVLPMILRGSGLTSNLDYDESVDRYGLWKVTILKNVWVHGKLLRPNDTAELDGATVQQLVGSGRATVTDKRLAAENSIIDQAVALGLPTKIVSWPHLPSPRKRNGR
jgi:hypothetical protein